MKPKQLLIFEGPDGGGKTTIIKRIRDRDNYSIIHHGAYPGIGRNIARIYADCMMPAIVGDRPIIFDRAWHSEVPYGRAFRNGEDRLGCFNRGILENLALKCNAKVILCLPPWETVRENYLSRKGIEYLDNVEQLRVVYDSYEAMTTDIPVFKFDYINMRTDLPNDWVSHWQKEPIHELILDDHPTPQYKFADDSLVNRILAATVKEVKCQ